MITLCPVVWCLLGCTRRPSAPAESRYEVGGRVVHQKKPLPWLLATFHRQGSAADEHFDTGTDKDGHFQIELPAGFYRITLTNLPRQNGAAPSAGDLGGVPIDSALLKHYRRAADTPLKENIPEGGRKDLILDVR